MGENHLRKKQDKTMSQCVYTPNGEKNYFLQFGRSKVELKPKKKNAYHTLGIGHTGRSSLQGQTLRRSHISFVQSKQT
jgi:hypothetical protein